MEEVARQGKCCHGRLLITLLVGCAERTGSAATMTIGNGLAVDAWGDHDLGAETGARQCCQVHQNGDQVTRFDLDGGAQPQFEAAQ